jgi:hypothetical protein
MNDLPRCELERRSSQHKGIFFEVPVICSGNGDGSEPIDFAGCLTWRAQSPPLRKLLST